MNRICNKSRNTSFQIFYFTKNAFALKCISYLVIQCVIVEVRLFILLVFEFRRLQEKIAGKVKLLELICNI